MKAAVVTENGVQYTDAPTPDNGWLILPENGATPANENPAIPGGIRATGR